MDDLRFGSALRVMRTRRSWRQSDLAAQAGVSRGTVSRLERGHLDELSVSALRRVAAAAGIRVELRPRSRDADLDRLINARHARLVEDVIRWLGEAPGWLVRPEISFAHYGERGVIDLVGWHAARRALLVVEVKTTIVDVGELLATFGRKIRLAHEVVAPPDWRPREVAALLVVAESATNRRAIAAHRATFRAALPADGRAVRGWLARPAGPLRAITFYANARPGSVRSDFAPVRRVRARRTA